MPTRDESLVLHASRKLIFICAQYDSTLHDPSDFTYDRGLRPLHLRQLVLAAISTWHQLMHWINIPHTRTAYRMKSIQAIHNQCILSLNITNFPWYSHISNKMNASRRGRKHTLRLR